MSSLHLENVLVDEATTYALSEAELHVLRESWILATANGEFGIDVYNRLFYIRPDVRSYFKRHVHHARSFISKMTLLITNLNANESTKPSSYKAGILHGTRSFGATDYEYFFNALIYGLKTHLKNDFNESVIHVWTKFYFMLVQ